MHLIVNSVPSNDESLITSLRPSDAPNRIFEAQWL